DQAIEAIGPEAPIAHPPNERDWAIAKGGQTALDRRECLPRRMVGTVGYIVHEPVNAAAVRPVVIRHEIAGRDCGLERLVARKRHAKCRKAEQVGPLHREAAEYRDAAGADS